MPDAADTFWVLLRSRLDEVAGTLPRDLRGVVQLCITTGAATRYHYLFLDGKESRAGDGIAEHTDAWVDTTEADLERLLEAGSPGTLRTAGNFALAAAFFDALSAAPRPRRIWQRGEV